MRLASDSLWNLRNEIVLCSIYVSDYENSFDFDASLLFNFFEGYTDYLEEIMKEDANSDSVDFFALLDDYDNEKNLWDYYYSLEQECIDCLFVK